MSDEIIDMTDASYAGQSHHRVRRQRTQWASQFAVGPEGDAEERMVKYIKWLFGDKEEARK